jgi:hypothetical protein
MHISYGVEAKEQSLQGSNEALSRYALKPITEGRA